MIVTDALAPLTLAPAFERSVGDPDDQTTSALPSAVEALPRSAAGATTVAVIAAPRARHRRENASMRAEDDSPSEPRMIVRAVIRAKREAGARRVFAKLQRYLGRSLAIQTIEPYRKDPQCFDIHAIAALPGASRAEIVYALLRDTGDLRGRAVGGPSEYSEGRWEMHLCFSKEQGAESISHIPGLVWLGCNVGNVV